MDDAWLYDRYRELHERPPNSRARDYIRGRIDEYCAQNAVSPTTAAAARARALGDIQAGIVEVHE
jgi:hypothetical protein